MKKLLIVIVNIVVSSNIIFAQTNETLVDLKINSIKMDEPIIGDYKDNKIEIKNDYFKEIIFKTNKSNKVNQIDLIFAKDKILLNNQNEILDIFKNNFGDGRKYADYLYVFTKQFDRAVVIMDYILGVKYSKIVFYIYEPEISERIDEFTNTKYISIESTGWDEVYVNSDTYYKLGFKGVEQKDFKGIFMTISTSNDDWKFIEKLIFLNDGETFEISAKSEREVTKEGKTKELVAVFLSESQISKILNSQVSKLRISGKVNDDLVLPFIVKETLRRLNEYINNK